MIEEISIKIIARIHTEFPTKFGVPRQSGLVDSLRASIVFEEEYRNPEALRGMDGFSHIWLIWQFSQAVREGWSPTVRPPRLGGNTRMGVFATRSPFRPNAIGLSSVKIEEIQLHTPQGPVIIVSGADLMDGTPILDIKPYLPFTDNHPDALGGFAEPVRDRTLTVDIPMLWLKKIPPEKQQALRDVLAQDPRPSYQNDPQRIYGMEFGRWEIRFRVEDNRLTVCEVIDRI